LPSDQVDAEEYNQNSIQEVKDFPQPKVMALSPSIPKDRYQSDFQKAFSAHKRIGSRQTK